MRPARIDEVFEVEAEHTNVRAPFDQLTPEEWERVRDWPIAYLNEVEVRLIERPGNVRLDDLEQRVNLQVRSGSGIY